MDCETDRKEVQMNHYGLDLTAWAVANYEELADLPPVAQRVLDDLFEETEQSFDMEDLGKAWDHAGPPPTDDDDDMDLWFDRIYDYLA